MPLTRAPLAALLAAVLVAGVVHADAPASRPAKYKWQKDPGPIAGRWKVSCRSLAGMIVAFSVDGRRATGVVAALGEAGAYGYVKGETIFNLTADDFGEWVGQARWRSVAGAERWDPIRFVATAAALDSTQATDGCFRQMPKE